MHELYSIETQLRAIRLRRLFFQRLTVKSFLGQDVKEEIARLKSLEAKLTTH